MGTKKLVGPVSKRVAAILTAQADTLGLSHQALADLSPYSSTAIRNSLNGASAFSLQLFVDICPLLELDPVVVLEDVTSRKKDPAKIILGPLVSTAEASRQELVQ